MMYFHVLTTVGRIHSCTCYIQMQHHTRYSYVRFISWNWQGKSWGKNKTMTKDMISIFPFICGNISAASALLNIYMSQLMQYSKGCCSYPDFLDWGLLLTKKLLNQIPSGYVEFITDQDLLLSSWSWLGCLIWNMLEVITYITFQ